MFSVLRSPFSVLRSPFSVLMVICLFYSNISAQISLDRSQQYQVPEEPGFSPSGDCGNSALFTITKTSSCCLTATDNPTSFLRRTIWNMGTGGDIPFQGLNSQTSLNICYSQAANYTIAHTVFLQDGTPCTSSQTVSMNCEPCPQILDIDIVNTSTWFPSTIPSFTCSAVGFAGDGNNTPELNRCPYRCTPVLNTNSSGFTFNWEMSIEDALGFSYYECGKQGPEFYVVNNKGYETYYIRVKVTATSSCGTMTKSKRIALNQPMACAYTVVPFRPTGGNTNNESLVLTKKITTADNIQIFPNPVGDILHVSNINDFDAYTFDIHNTLGQTVLSQKVSSIDAAVNVTDLMTGVYIGIVKSQGKIIATKKIYKK